MTDISYPQYLDLAAGLFLLSAIGVLWRHQLAPMIRLFGLQGAALATIVAILGIHQHSLELILVALGLGVLRAGVLPALARRASQGSAPARSTPSPTATRISSRLCWWMPRIATMAASAAPCRPNSRIIEESCWRHSTPIAVSRNSPAARSRNSG